MAKFPEATRIMAARFTEAVIATRGAVSDHALADFKGPASTIAAENRRDERDKLDDEGGREHLHRRATVFASPDRPIKQITAETTQNDAGRKGLFPP